MVLHPPASRTHRRGRGTGLGRSHWQPFFVASRRARGALDGGHHCYASGANAALFSTLVIRIEGNLTRADAYLSGQAADFDDPGRFYAAFQSKIRELAKLDEALHRYSCSVLFADPRTLWTLGRSALDYPAPGEDYLSLTCSCIYYWDSVSTTADSKAFLARHNIRDRKTFGLGHWPMTKAPAQFYAAVEQDVLRAND